MRSRIITNTGINIIHTFISFVLAYAMTPIILHRVGGEAYGIWVFLGIFSISGYFSLLDFGFQGAAIKYVAEYTERKDTEKLQHLVSSILLFFLVVGIIGAIGVVIFNIAFLSDVFHLPVAQENTIRILVNLIAISFVFQFPALGFSALIEGLQRYGYMRVVSIVITIISNIVLLSFLSSANGLTMLVWVMVASSLAITLCYGFIAKKFLPGIHFFRLAFDRTVMKILFSLSGKLFASKIVGLIFNNTDKILIGIFLTVFEQTDYDIVNKLHIILLTLLSMMNSAILPATSAFNANNDTKSLQVLLLRGTKYSAALLLPAFAFLMVFPGQLLEVWVGKDYIHLGPIIQLYISHMILTMLVGISSTMLVGVDKVQVGLRISLWAAVINLGIGLVTVKTLGITGLILGTVVAYMLSSLLYIFSTNKIFEIRHSEFVARTIVPLLIPTVALMAFMAIAYAYIPISHLITAMVVAGSAYVIFLGVFYFVSLEKDERIYLKNVFRKKASST